MSGTSHSEHEQNQQRTKSPILGQGHGLSDQEGQMIQQMIREESGTRRNLTIPQEDLAPEATTRLSPEAARVINASRVRDVLQLFNRDYLYGQGRFDEYKDGFLLKWGDGYSRKHIWMTVENGNLIFETSHFKKCDKPYCTGTHHVLTPDLYTNWDIINQELGDRFRRPVYERSED
ncbi:MAG TPA: hypothetical protein VL485_12165 [Ktedonobacteraceae bacterium]|nr:hypothetical protein [Ktedonobacteraceae bacterium]